MAAPNSNRDGFMRTGVEELKDSTFKESKTDCAICHEAETLDAPSDQRIVKITTCSHVFHYACLCTWLESLGTEPGTCPSCRYVLYQRIESTVAEDHVLDTSALEMTLHLMHVHEQLFLLQESGLFSDHHDQTTPTASQTVTEVIVEPDSTSNSEENTSNEENDSVDNSEAEVIDGEQELGY